MRLQSTNGMNHHLPDSSIIPSKVFCRAGELKLQENSKTQPLNEWRLIHVIFSLMTHCLCLWISHLHVVVQHVFSMQCCCDAVMQGCWTCCLILRAASQRQHLAAVLFLVLEHRFGYRTVLVISSVYNRGGAKMRQFRKASIKSWACKVYCSVRQLQY